MRSKLGCCIVGIFLGEMEGENCEIFRLQRDVTLTLMTPPNLNSFRTQLIISLL